jgi:hypothetical protein
MSIAPWHRPQTTYCCPYMLRRYGFELGCDYRNRTYGVRATNDEDIWFFDPRERDTWRLAMKFVPTITIVNFDSGQRWIFIARTADFPDGFKNTDSYAYARLADHRTRCQHGKLRKLARSPSLAGVDA